VNDELGHGAGDRFLKRAAYAWRSALRLSDILARWGGEEFVACFPDCELDAAVAVVERIRAATPDGRTCSAGVARWDGSESVESLIGRADRAMYAAKDGGRDRTESARHIGPA
jgi:diguanylate cyclase (GGDEF)-like protein